MSLETNGSCLKAFLADPAAWSDYGGYENVALAFNNGVPTQDWELEDVIDSDRIEVIAGYRISGSGERLGCFVSLFSTWLLASQIDRVMMELPAYSLPSLQEWAHNVGASCLLVGSD
jgi:hypothetical protein